MPVSSGIGYTMILRYGIMNPEHQVPYSSIAAEQNTEQQNPTPLLLKTEMSRMRDTSLQA